MKCPKSVLFYLIRLVNAQQFAKRLLVNILLANEDAHLKNWSLLYEDQAAPELLPAYDIRTISDEKGVALNMGKTKKWYEANMSHFEAWSKKCCHISLVVHRFSKRRQIKRVFYLPSTQFYLLCFLFLFSCACKGK